MVNTYICVINLYNVKKRLFSFLCFLLPLFGFAQNTDALIAISEQECVNIAETFIELSQSKKVFESFDTKSPNASSFAVRYREVNTSNLIVCDFKKYMIGENSNMEIPGTPRYYFKSVIGPFLLVFPIWKQFIEPDADIDEVSSSTQTRSKNLIYDGKEVRFTLHKQSNGEWQLYIFI